MKKVVIVTGATGFIGRHTLPLLQELGYEVHAFSSSKIASSSVHWHQVDLLNDQDYEKCVQSIQPTHLLHFAWIATHGQFWTSPFNINWMEASLRLVRTVIEAGGQRVVVSGTCAEYDWHQETYSESTSLFRPATLYGASKRALYQALEAYANQLPFSFAWGYIFYLFGVHEDPRRFIPSLIKNLLQKQEVPCSHGFQIRDFLSVEDVARAFVSLLDSSVTGGVNIGSGKGISLRQVGELIEQLTSCKGYLDFGAIAPPKIDPPRLVADVKRLREELNWTPSETLETGLQKAIAWWKIRL